jgi:hypothetical protein
MPLATHFVGFVSRLANEALMPDQSVSPNVRGALEAMETIATHMAAAAEPLFKRPTLARYRAALSACYFYTRLSGPQLERAAGLAPTEELRFFFAEMAREEGWHYRLAQRDLEALGAHVSGAAPEVITAFASYWDSIPAERFFEFLGATWVLENLAGCLRRRALAALAELGLGREGAGFILTHLEADEDHGRRADDLCRAYLPERAEPILAGARTTAHYWEEGVRGFLADHV